MIGTTCLCCCYCCRSAAAPANLEELIDTDHVFDYLHHLLTYCTAAAAAAGGAAARANHEESEDTEHDVTLTDSQMVDASQQQPMTQMTQGTQVLVWHWVACMPSDPVWHSMHL